MKPKTAELEALLEKFRHENAAFQEESDGTQVLHEPEEFPRGIPTIAKNVYHPASPLVAARFRFCGAWEGAWLFHHWLSISEMERAWTDEELLDQIATRRDYWEHSVVADNPPERLTLFGVERIEGSETYLLWCDAPEPKVVVYEDQSSTTFDNLLEFLRAITGLRSD